MNITQETDYAFRLINAFATMDPGIYLTARCIAEKESIPFRFLLRVMGKLKRAKIIASRQGIDGGYRLAKPAGEISFRSVIEAVEGGVDIARCLQNPGFCNAGRAPQCRVHKALSVIQQNLLQDLDSYTFANMDKMEPKAR